jgi:hypothetical protein
MENRIKINKCNLYLLLWIIQLVHAPLNLYGNIVSVVVLFILYFWSLYYCFIAITKYKLPSVLKAWSVLFFLFSIYAIIRIINPDGLSYNIGFEINSRMYLMEHWTSMLPIYPFFVCSKTGQINKKLIRKWTILFIGVAIIRYYYGRTIALAKLSHLSNIEEATNNMGYFIAMTMPLMFFWRNRPTIQYIGNAVLIVFVLLAAKRGAIILGLMCLFMQIMHSLKSKKNTNSLGTYIVLIVFFILGYYYISKFLSTNEFFMSRLEKTMEGDDSNRGQIYRGLLQVFVNKANAFNWLFGFGADGTVLLYHQQAHNDWIQILIDMGIIGIIAFLSFWVQAFSTFKRIIGKDVKRLYFMVVLMLFVRTFFSMSINDMCVPSNLILGYCMANINNVVIENQ